jgi:hypothetical protein
MSFAVPAGVLSGWPLWFSVTPWLCGYFPVRIEERAGQHIGMLV